MDRAWGRASGQGRLPACVAAPLGRPRVGRTVLPSARLVRRRRCGRLGMQYKHPVQLDLSGMLGPMSSASCFLSQAGGQGAIWTFGHLLVPPRFRSMFRLACQMAMPVETGQAPIAKHSYLMRPLLARVVRPFSPGAPDNEAMGCFRFFPFLDMSQPIVWPTLGCEGVVVPTWNRCAG